MRDCLCAGENLVAAVELRNVTKYFGDLCAVNSVTMCARPGEFVSLLGPSGCGKTTLLRLIAGFERVDQGEILINGSDVADLPPYDRNIGMVFQSYALFPHMTVRENVSFGLRMRRVPGVEMQSRVEKALALVRLSGMEDRYPRQLSGGQQQRVALARALVIEPRVLLLDEPLSNLDARLRDEMRVEVRQIQQTVGITTIFVTHDQEEALVMSDRVVVMNQGRVVQEGSPVEVYERPAHSFVAAFIGQSNLLWGRVVARQGGVVRIQTDGGLDLEVAADSAPGVGSRVLTVVKQTRIQMKRPDGALGPNTFTGTLEFVTYLGANIQYLCRVGQARLAAILPNDSGAPPLRSGDPVLLSWKPEDCLLIRE